MMQVQKLVLNALRGAELTNGTVITAWWVAHRINSALTAAGGDFLVTEDQVLRVLNRLASKGGYQGATRFVSLEKVAARFFRPSWAQAS